MMTAHWRALVTLALLTAAGVGARQAGAQGISSTDASQYVGERQVVEGKVTEVRREGKVVRLGFGPDPNGFTVAVIFGLLRDVPPDIESTYQGRTIRVEGKIRSFHGAPEMLIQDLTLIEFVDARPTPAAVVPEEEAELREEIQRIETRLDRVEQEIKALRKK
jgi:hypothetical protein